MSYTRWKKVEASAKRIKAHKASGKGGLPTEDYQYGGDQLLDKLKGLLTSCWTKGEVPPLGIALVIVMIQYKSKREKPDCSNYEGMILLSIAGKILALVLLHRMIPACAEEVLPGSQCRFRANHGTADMIFFSDAREVQRAEYCTLGSLQRPDESDRRGQQRKVQEHLRVPGEPPRFVAIEHKVYTGQKSQVKHSGEF
ncbi:RNA-directed DNA polymerase from mobile element jockey-like protein [Elysia marginata]|uniref:RNA-directed DNA polymerase from mobile element jockey-like protein n=1 Tax=Elysia marginata TaxID=1093978 RepID=A0AAV4G4Y6_9GAST|nr:RNA-directed DNA polymerase from mobile element jockey-like protein [Elysia marginata]